jgi:hypothetical protein
LAIIGRKCWLNSKQGEQGKKDLSGDIFENCRDPDRWKMVAETQLTQGYPTLPLEMHTKCVQG